MWCSVEVTWLELQGIHFLWSCALYSHNSLDVQHLWKHILICVVFWHCTTVDCLYQFVHTACAKTCFLKLCLQRYVLVSRFATGLWSVSMNQFKNIASWLDGKEKWKAWIEWVKHSVIFPPFKLLHSNNRQANFPASVTICTKKWCKRGLTSCCFARVPRLASFCRSWCFTSCLDCASFAVDFPMSSLFYSHSVNSLSWHSKTDVTPKQRRFVAVASDRRAGGRSETESCHWHGDKSRALVVFWIQGGWQLDENQQIVSSKEGKKKEDKGKITSSCA